MFGQASIKTAKSLLWICLGVVLLSPLYINSHLFFPFIVTKTVAFNIAVEVMFLLFLFLCWKTEDYKFKVNVPIVLMAVYIVLTFISSLFGNDFARSFWSNNERSEGILLLLHLFLFLIVLTGFLRKMKDWLILLDMSFLAGLLVSLVALGQYFEVDWLLKSSGGQRLAGTIGNAGYMAGYLFFAVFTGLFLLFKRPNLYAKAYYGIFILLDIFIIFNTYTRGGILALIFSLFLLGFYLALFYFNSKQVRNVVLAIWVVLVVAGGLIYLNRDAAWIKSNPVLSRATDISTGSNTSQNRLWTWQSAFKGFKERPILGYGYENFYQPFDKYFDPRISRKAGSVVWFDRAHNMILDRLVSGGVLGLVSYLSFLFAPLFYLWREYRRKEGDKKKYLVPVVCTITMLGYFIQNLFIFEALVIYIPLFVLVAFIGVFGPAYEWKFLELKKFRAASLIVSVVLFLPILYIFTLKPLNANMDVTRALSSPDMTVAQRVDLFKEVLDRNTGGNQEYRRQLLDFTESALKSEGLDKTDAIKLLEFTDDQLKKQLSENPHSVANYLLRMRFNEIVYSMTGNPAYLNDNLALGQKAMELAPTRQHVYYEIGYTHFYLANYYSGTKELDKVKESHNLAIDQFEKALKLNEVNFDSYRQLANILIYAGENNKLKALFADLPGLQKKVYVPFKVDEFLNQMLGISVQVKNQGAVDFFSQTFIKLEPQNPQSYVQSALAYAYLGQDNKAIELAGKVAAFGPDFAKESNDFIERVKRGEFKK